MARRPTVQQPKAVAAADRRALAAGSPTSSEEGDSEEDGTAVAVAEATSASEGIVGTSADHSSDEGSDGAAANGVSGAANGAANGAFVPDLSKLKKLGKRAGPGIKVVARQADRAEEAGKKKAAPAKKGKQARVWGEAGGKGECLVSVSPALLGLATFPALLMCHRIKH
jgi:hypothetical protein